MSSSIGRFRIMDLFLVSHVEPSALPPDAAGCLVSYSPERLDVIQLWIDRIPLLESLYVVWLRSPGRVFLTRRKLLT